MPKSDTSGETSKISQDEEGEISAELYSHLYSKREAMLFKFWVQVRYHRRRQRFFDLVDKGTKTVTLLLGATLFGKYMNQGDIHILGIDVPLLNIVGTLISALGLLTLIFGYGDRKQLHKELAEAAANKVAEIEEIPEQNIMPTDTAKWASDYAKFCAKAPPPLKTLTIICEHEQASIGPGENKIKLPPPFWCWIAQLKS